MKKLLIMFFGLAILTSCSSDDDNMGADPILGTWVLVDASLVTPENCENESTITFTADNNANGTFYLEETNCEAETSSGTWENLGDSRYLVEVPVAGDLEGTVTFFDDDNFVFTSGIGTFTFERQ